ncbi:hypothetical protein CVT26_008799 [Gymnopilus dilepis]|uniref:Uncharacterized protein n=1 Tax=Gymnopilus dilepis TaxID=231916 RepID=A0A409YSB9_9AGAR|nr:hypothetical protein CVT26_008799 [Gymnopilus dilepis]
MTGQNPSLRPQALGLQPPWASATSMLLSLDFPALAALSFVPSMPAQTDADDSEASTPPKPANLTPTRPVSTCTMQTYCTNGVPSGWRPPILWRKSTYYWMSLVCLFLATVLAIVAFSIRTSYRGGAFLDKDKLPVLFYAAAVFIGALPLAGVCALFRYESDIGTGWALLCTLLLSFLSLGPIFIFSLETSESDVFTEDRTSGSLAYLVATFCVISSMACKSTGSILDILM